ncbi:hypothetical protein F3Y22_tig00111848pilonHSYRG00224 [Hibiscus syriacus]|uniref:Uncharacterized protein n=1 Tax=Hibiscus syriacus TaxID=106335 RepID=A0A6A2XAB0_HIBSY|nr:hypothetical protein F3Y22_tig00111848pilonHSYRG00224 [Hibiscus syriacus]
MFSGGVWVLRRFGFIGLDEALIGPYNKAVFAGFWKARRGWHRGNSSFGSDWLDHLAAGTSRSWRGGWGRGPRVIITLGFPSGGF